MGRKRIIRYRQLREKLKSFFSEEIWHIDFEPLSKFSRSFIRSLRVFLITIRTFSAQKIGFQAVALSFFCTMAVVPFVAVAFAITDGFGLSEHLRALLYSNFSGSQETIDMLLEFANNVISTAQSSIVGLISALLFVWLVIWMLLCVETVFNNVWKVEKSRNFFRRLGVYTALILIAPFIMLLLFAGAMVYSNMLESFGLNVEGLKIFTSFISWLIFDIVATMTFSAMYKFIPNYTVKYKYALRAAIFSGLAFTLLQLGYLETQIFITRLNTIYGAIAAIPFFMFWLNFAWFIILFGAELSYAFQNVDNYIEKMKAKSNLTPNLTPNT